MANLHLILLNFNETSIPAFFAKIIILAICIISLNYIFKALNEKPDLEKFLKEKRNRNMREAYLRAVRARNYDRVISEEDLKYIAMSDQEFDIVMLEENCDELIYFELFKEDNRLRIRQAQISKEWMEKQRRDDGGEWEIKDKKGTPLPSFMEFRKYGFKGKKAV